jgi:hypothetical protein
MRTAYFFGAGASKADRFPVTRELLCPLAAWLMPHGRGVVAQGKELYALLNSAFGVTTDELRIAAQQWDRHCSFVAGEKVRAIPRPPDRLPNLTDILSILDTLLSDEGGFGLETDTSRVLKGRSLQKAREQVATAIAQGFNELDRVTRDRKSSPLLIDRFISPGVIRRGDVLVTTNWDILLDKARDRAFGSTPGDYGTQAHLEGTALRREDKKRRRPKLFKLHGSLNWLYCPRCSCLRIDVATVTAHDGYKPSTKNKRSRCQTCHMPCEALLVTPTFLKSYRNRHLLNIWAQAQQAMAVCARWVFIGYSLPDDDIHIKALLLKAKRMRFDVAGRDPEIQVVTHLPDDGLRDRYARLFGDRVIFKPREGGFEAYVRARVHAAEREASKRKRREMQKARETARRVARRKRSRLKKK